MALRTHSGARPNISEDKKTPFNNGQDPLDIEHLSRYTLSDRNLEREILSLFCEQLPKSLQAIRMARSPKEWQIATHTLKGSARSVGAWYVAELAAEAENAGHQRMSPKDEEALLARLEAAATEVKQYIEQRAKEFN